MIEKKPKLGLFLFAIFGLLIISVIVALYLGATEEKQQSAPIEGQVTIAEMRDYLAKMNLVIGKREITSVDGQQALKQTASMIEGTLGPMNLGYEVSRSANQRAEGLLWKTLWIDAGKKESEDLVLLAVPYGESGTPVAFALGFAEYLVGMNFKKKVRLVFTPPINTISLEDRVLSDDESIVKMIQLRGGGGAPYWAEISGGRLTEVISSDPIWKQHIAIAAEQETTTLSLGERGAMGSREHSKQLLKLFPVLVKLIRD